MKTLHCHILFFSALFLLIGQVNQILACPALSPDSGYSADNHYYDSQSSAFSACSSASGSCSHNSGSGWSYYYYVSPGVQHFYAYGCTLDVPCSSQRAAASQQCGGDDKYDINEQTCVATCKVSCATERAALEQQCGGPDSYNFDATWCTGRCKDFCQENARTACHDAPYKASSIGSLDLMSNTRWYEGAGGECKKECKCPNYDGSVPYDQYDFDTCQVKPSGSSCDSEALAANCPSHELATLDYQTCNYTCKNCLTRESECNAKCPQGGKLYDCKEGSTQLGDCVCIEEDCVQISELCDQNCVSKGGVLAFNCTSADGCVCRNDATDCQSVKNACSTECSARGGVKANECTQLDGKVAGLYCRCVQDSEPIAPPIDDLLPNVNGTLPKDCDYYHSQCNPACNFFCVSDPVTGHAKEGYSCDCSTQPDSNPNDPSNPSPSDNPSNSGDSNGWLSSIKSNTDTIVEQNNDVKGWIEGVKKNSDVALDLDTDRNKKLDNVAENLRRIVENDGVTNRNNERFSKNQVDAISKVEKGIVGKGGTNEILGETNKGIGSVNKGIGELNAGFRNVSIGTDNSGLVGLQSLGGGGEVTGTGYGSAPTDLPTDTSFGTFTPRDSDSRSLVQTKLSGLSIGASDPVCGLTLKLPRLTAGWTWELIDFPVDFCPYESILSAIGTLLVFAAALNELYKFS